MARSSSSFNRGKSKYKQQPTVLILCEDTKAGKVYLEDAARHFRCHVLVKIAHCGKTNPIGIVEEAKNRSASFDEVYCVIDRDSHPRFDEALEMARIAPKVTAIPSYPCFEFWLILHFGYNRQPFVARGRSSPGDCAVQLLKTKQGMEAYDKSTEGIFTHLESKLSVARVQSPRVLTEAGETGEMNPSTLMHTLIGKLEELGKPVPI